MSKWVSRPFLITLLGSALASSALGQVGVRMTTAVASPYQANGVAVAADGRIFLSLPRLIQQDSFSVGLVENGKVKAYPGDAWNTTTGETSNRFSNVNAVRIEPQRPDSLWVVDCGSGKAGETKLVQITLRENRVHRVYRLSPAEAPAHSCLNDVRVSDGRAFLTESGTGAIVIIDLTTGEVLRRLATSATTKAPNKPALVVDGRPLVDPHGQPITVHADDIELSPDREWLYFSVPFGGTLWRVRTADLLDRTMSESALSKRVESLGPMMPVGGILMLADGSLLMGDLVNHALVRRFPDGKIAKLFSSPELRWPDAMAVGPDGDVYEAAPQGNASPANNKGKDDTVRPFKVFRFTLPSIDSSALAPLRPR
ncbi:MAG: L-dopachrome tautomerase-related protein [Acidobacteriaceae bacterium]|nr:L-dopachrome tautomerase-related protein [Acidobacteriaceae bacterium]